VQRFSLYNPEGPLDFPSLGGSIPGLDLSEHARESEDLNTRHGDRGLHLRVDGEPPMASTRLHRLTSILRTGTGSGCATVSPISRHNVIPKDICDTWRGCRPFGHFFKTDPQANASQSLFFRNFISVMLRFAMESTLGCLEASPMGVGDAAAIPLPWYTADDPRCRRLTDTVLKNRSLPYSHSRFSGLTRSSVARQLGLKLVGKSQWSCPPGVSGTDMSDAYLSCWKRGCQAGGKLTCARSTPR